MIYKFPAYTKLLAMWKLVMLGNEKNGNKRI